MKLSQFRFDLPLNLIAQNPTKKREDSRMMVIDRKTGNIENKHFREIIDYFDDKDDDPFLIFFMYLNSPPPLTGGNQGRFHFVVVIGCHMMEWFPSNEHRLLSNIAS